MENEENVEIMKDFDPIENAQVGFRAIEKVRWYARMIKDGVCDAKEANENLLLFAAAIETVLESASEELAKAQVALAGVAATARHASDHYAKAVNYIYRQLDQSSPEFRQFEEALWDGSRTLDTLIDDNS